MTSPATSPDPLETQHLSQLHALAGERGVSGYRLMRREALIAALQSSEADEADAPKRRSRGRRGGRGRSGRVTAAVRELLGDVGESDQDLAPEGGDPERAGAGPTAGAPERGDEAPAGATAEPEPEDVGEPTVGVIDITPRRHGFLRGPDLVRSEGDVYVSPAQIRRCELRIGDLVSGPARQPRRDERHPALIHVDSVEGGEPEAARPDFDALTPTAPSRRIELGSGSPMTRAVDLLGPLAFGQRVLVMADPRSGATTLIEGLTEALAGREGVEIWVLLLDERPEEATRWRDGHPGVAILAVTADREPTEQLRTTRLVLERARRRVEVGADVILIVDSLNRLAVAEGEPTLAKRVFSSGRESAEVGAGSLTVIAVAQPGGPGGATEAVQSTENLSLRLDADLAAAGIIPSLVPRECRAVGEDALRDPAELAAVRAVREQLVGLSAVEASKQIAELLGSSADNPALLGLS